MTEHFGRSEFLKRALGWLGARVADQVTASLPDLPAGRVRPPGALAEAEFLLTCHRCGLCVEACPPLAIRPLPTSAGLAARTPAIDPVQAACRLCTDTPCITACPSGALAPLTDVLAARMGLAKLTDSACLVSAGKACDFCVVSCPVPGALGLTEGGFPVIEAATCTGCGVCVHVCPAQPKALRLVPVPGSGV